MVTIEQVELLESKVSKAIDYVKRLTADNEQLRGTSARLVSENNMLHGKLDGYQKRIAELEVSLQGFKRDQERIEQGIVSALERLNHFEDAVGETSAREGASSGTAADGSTRSEELETSVNWPSLAPAVPPPVAAQPIAASAGIPVVIPSEPRVEEEEVADGAYGESDSDLLELPEPDDDDVSEADDSDETFGETSGETEIEPDGDEGFSEDGEYGKNGQDDEDEFLGVLKNDRPSGLGQIAATFHENAVPSSENLLEKPASGLELDIF
jgi:FtsZ-binding cell division protein ZapB